jgi:hypothetical protein
VNRNNEAKVGWKRRIIRELIRYWINVVYLGIFFAAFTWYRRLILAQYHITYLHYWISVLEALVLAKVILVGDALGLSRGFEDKPLIYPTLHKTVVFTLFVGVFGLLEHLIMGLFHGIGLKGGWAEFWGRGKDELLARCLVVFFVFIPFFAFRELGAALGEGKLKGLFFRRRAHLRSGPQGSKSE